MNDLAEFLNWESSERKLKDALCANSAHLSEILRLFASEPAILLRNWYGKLALLLPCAKDELERSSARDFLDDLQLLVPALALSPWLVCRDELFGAEQYWTEPALIDLLAPEPNDTFPALKLLERQDKEGEWLRTPNMQSDRAKNAAKRAVFFSIKGGVGRSTALVMLAIDLARQGKKVLVLDGDFESPGLSSSLLPRGEGQPDYGLVDWLTAQALGAKESVLKNMARRHIAEVSPLNAALALRGQILVSPAYGKQTQAYVLKLGRVYRNSQAGMSYAQRLHLLLQTLESQHCPDVVLFDSRAGIDDTAAVALTQLDADVSFLFAINTAQTWDSYGLLFQHWRRNLALFGQDQRIQPNESLTQKLRVVAALSSQEGLDEGFLNHAYDCFQAIYEDDPDGEGKGFSPALDQVDAPHMPMRILATDALRAFDPLKNINQVNGAVNVAVFDDFLTKARLLLSSSTTQSVENE